ncbi:MAG: hypothetical protein KIT10_11940 [Flavobacteriales bacterium]|nr:hypothetical protein [Flavobacteriales bacterium]
MARLRWRFGEEPQMSQMTQMIAPQELVRMEAIVYFLSLCQCAAEASRYLRYLRHLRLN